MSESEDLVEQASSEFVMLEESPAQNFESPSVPDVVSDGTSATSEMSSDEFETMDSSCEIEPLDNIIAKLSDQCAGSGSEKSAVNNETAVEDDFVEKDESGKETPGSDGLIEQKELENDGRESAIVVSQIPNETNGRLSDEEGHADDDETDSDSEFDGEQPPHEGEGEVGVEGEKNHVEVVDEVKSGYRVRHIMVAIVAVLAACTVNLWAPFVDYAFVLCTSWNEELQCPAPFEPIPHLTPNPTLDARVPSNPKYIRYKWSVERRIGAQQLLIDFDGSKLVLDQLDVGAVKLLLDLRLGLKSRTCNVDILIFEAPVLAIDLGTTYSCVAYPHNELDDTTLLRPVKIIPLLHPNDESRKEFCIPSQIYFPPDREKEDFLFGERALKKAATNPQSVVLDLKRLIGQHRDSPAVVDFKAVFRFNFSETDSSPKLLLPNYAIYPEEGLALLLNYLVRVASRRIFGANVERPPYLRDVVVSIPANFNNAQRKGVRSACHLAGLRPKRLVVEPTAAALAQSYEDLGGRLDAKLLLVFDFGGGTLDCSVIQCSGPNCDVFAVVGDSNLGGREFDKVLSNIIIQRIRDETKWKIGTQEKRRILISAERAKKQLSTGDHAHVSVRNENNDQPIVITITRREFEEQSQHLVQRAVDLARKAIESAELIRPQPVEGIGGYDERQIDHVLMIGGTTKLPMIRKALEDHFGKEKLVQPKHDPQEMVVRGAGIIAGWETYEKENLEKAHYIRDVIPLALGFAVCRRKEKGSDVLECGLMDKVIKKNSMYPKAVSTSYCQKDGESTVADLDVYEGDSKHIDANHFIGNFRVEGIPKRLNSKCNTLNVTFDIDESGIATIRVDLSTGVKSKQFGVASDDGRLSCEQMRQISRKMALWFRKNPHVSSILRNPIWRCENV